MGDTAEVKLRTASRIIYLAWPRDPTLAKVVRESTGHLYDDKLRCDIAEGLSEKARSLDDVPYSGEIKETAEKLFEIQKTQYKDVVKEVVDLINNRMELVTKATGPLLLQLTAAIEKVSVERETAKIEEKKRKLDAKKKMLEDGVVAKKKKPRKEESSEEEDEDDGELSTGTSSDAEESSESS
jgi:hypothetical protein